MPQKHTRMLNGKRYLWYTERLWALAASLKPFPKKLDEIPELEMDCWFIDREPTIRRISEHYQRIRDCDPSWPIILNAEGDLMDGGHRVCKALAEGKATVMAVQFLETPAPDEIVSRR